MDTQTPNSEGSFTQQTPPPQTPNQTPSQNTGMAILSYLGILVIVPLLTEAKNDPFVKFHAKQGLVLLVGFIIASIIAIVPVVGWMLSPIVWLACLILMILGIVNAANHKQQELPVVGKYAENFHF